MWLEGQAASTMAAISSSSDCCVVWRGIELHGVEGDRVKYPEFPEEEDDEPSWRESESEVSSFGGGDDKDDDSSDGMSIIDEDKDFN